uniref:Uncharacterized protein n=1 Tax=Rhizophora mucronata TaxID=61149 RepID=A0A2P2PCN8_RHIMU
MTKRESFTRKPLLFTSRPAPKGAMINTYSQKEADNYDHFHVSMILSMPVLILLHYFNLETPFHPTKDGSDI